MNAVRNITKIKIKLKNLSRESNVYLLMGNEGYLLIDTGFEMRESWELIFRSIEELGLNLKDLTFIINTHSHPDHSGGNRKLKIESGAKIAIHKLEAQRISPTGDIILNDGEMIELNPIKLRVIYSPGHSQGHICLYLENERLLFSGDHVIEGTPDGTVYVGPPDGDVEMYLNSIRKISNLKIDMIFPGHGRNIIDPYMKIRKILKHHQKRERQILETLITGEKNVDQIAKKIYGNHISRSLAQGAVLGRLRKLANEKRIIQTRKGAKIFFSLRDSKLKNKSSIYNTS